MLSCPKLNYSPFSGLVLNKVITTSHTPAWEGLLPPPSVTEAGGRTPGRSFRPRSCPRPSFVPFQWLSNDHCDLRAPPCLVAAQCLMGGGEVPVLVRLPLGPCPAGKGLHEHQQIKAQAEVLGM